MRLGPWTQRPKDRCELALSHFVRPLDSGPDDGRVHSTTVPDPPDVANGMASPQQMIAGLKLTTLAAAKALPTEFLRDLGVSDGRWGSRPAVRISYRDEHDHEVAHQYRIALAGDRFRFPSGARPTLYGIWRLATTNTQAWTFLVEGPSDCWTLWFHGIPCVGVPSASIWSEEWTRHFDGISVIYVIDEGGDGGRTLLSALRQSSLRERIRFVSLDGAKDPSELYLADPEHFAASLGAARENANPLDEVLAHHAKRPTGLSLAEALTAVETLLSRYVVFPRPEAKVAVVLWIAHTYAMEYAEATPYLAISSPEKQSGKTRLLECLALLANHCNGIMITPTAPTIFRTLDATPGAALLLDELDAVFRDRSDKYEEVRALINAGHRRGATVPRMVSGPKNAWVVKQFQVFGPKALAGIGKLPDTVTDRSVPIRMVKRKRTESVDRFRQRTAQKDATGIVGDLVAALADTPPATEADVPADLPDRAADAWEALLAIADAAGDNWPSRARLAALVLHAGRQQDDSLGLRLLSDIRLVFDADGLQRIATADLIAALLADPEGPWVSDKSPLNAHRLAKLLRPFDIGSKQLRIGDKSLKGYERESFDDSWDRYLEPLPPSPEAKHRNTGHEQSFDVSDATPSGPDANARAAEHLSIEEDYPRSAWGPDGEKDDQQANLWAAVEPGESRRGDAA